MDYELHIVKPGPPLLIIPASMLAEITVLSLRGFYGDRERSE